jgi:hypothetical protein
MLLQRCSKHFDENLNFHGIATRCIHTMFDLGMRNSPGSSTSAVDIENTLRKRHRSSRRNELYKRK